MGATSNRALWQSREEEQGKAAVGRWAAEAAERLQVRFLTPCSLLLAPCSLSGISLPYFFLYLFSSTKSLTPTSSSPQPRNL